MTSNIRRVLFFLFCLGVFSVMAQNKGTIRGTIIEDETGEPLYSANVVVEGTQIGATSDFDGKFQLSAPAGKHNIKISFIGLSSTTITDVEVKAGEVTVIDIIRLKPASSELQTVTVTADAIKNTEAALLTIKKKSANVLDGLSAQSFRKMDDGNAAAAARRVPGVSVQGGKYVFVRGLGDRYTKTQLNNMDVPGLDPNRNSLQMDIFPTNLIDNIIVYKSFTADLPADFTGGVVNIETKSFPEKPSFRVNANLGYNPEMHFNDNYLQTERFGTDFLGFDNGSRDEPLGMSESNPTPMGPVPIPSNEKFEKSQEFNKTLDAQSGTSPMNFSLGVSGGNQIKLESGNQLGYIGSLSYRNESILYKDKIQNFYRRESSDPTVYELEPAELQQTDYFGQKDVFLSGMAGVALKTPTSKYKVNLMHLQNAEKRAGETVTQDIFRRSNENIRDNLEFNQRSLTNLLISGEHNLNNGKFNIDWRLAPTLSSMEDKDVRNTAFLIRDDGELTIDPNEVDFPSRRWRNLSEWNVASRADATWENKLWEKENKVKFGVSYVIKQRDYEILDYQLRVFDAPDFSGDPDQLLQDDFLTASGDSAGTYMFGNFQISNTFEGTISNAAAYVSDELEITTRLKSIVGLRLEKYDQFYTGEPQQAKPEQVFENERVLDLFNLFPTASLVYQTDENSNLRVAYFRTTARPSFKEKSYAEIVDPISGTTFIGNIDLQPTFINNFDLRYEYFFKKNQTIALSGFYKTFTDPIEMVAFPQDPDSFQPRNVGDATVMGLEFETRFNLGFINPLVQDFSFRGNVSFIDAKVTYAQSTLDNLEIGRREGEDFGETRDMQGQAPYIVNAGILYENRDKGWESGVFYNVQGPKLMIVGIGFTPNVYTVPFHSVNYNISKSFGEDRQYRISFAVNNILNDLREEEYQSFRATERLFSRFNPGRTFSIGFRYAIK